MNISRNNTSFPLQLANKLKKALEFYEEAKKHGEEEHKAIAQLYYYQYLVREYVCNFMHPARGVRAGKLEFSRGLLIAHGLGLGKTREAVAIAKTLNRPIVFLAKKGLHKNFENDYRALDMLGTVRGEVPIKYISQDAFNSAAKFGQETNYSLEGKLIIVDEAHNFFRSIVSSSSVSANAKQIYNAIMNARDVRLIFLTATPGVKDIFEFAACFNMLAGYELFPEDYDTFTDIFLQGDELANMHLFQNRIFGMVSYITPDDIGKIEVRDDGGLPEVVSTEVRKIVMDNIVVKKYATEYALELQAMRHKFRGRGPVAPMSIPSSKGSSYHIGTRQISNLAKMKDVMDIVHAAIPRADEISPNQANANEISPNQAKTGADEISPNQTKTGADCEECTKAAPVEMADAPSDFARGKIVIYSEFVNKTSGLGAIRILLEANGIAYGEISGKISTEERDKTQKAFNRGDFNVLLISASGAEGLDLKCVRHVLLLEPHWTYARMMQIIGRAVRRGSHNALPRNKRDVRIYILLAYPDEADISGELEEPESPPDEVKDSTKLRSIDDHIYQIALRRQKQLSKMRNVLRRVSIECSIISDKCVICTPNDQPLFTRDIRAEMDEPDRCVIYRPQVMSYDGEIILTDGRKIKYRSDENVLFGAEFYEYNEELEAWQKITPTEEMIALFENE